MDCIKKLEVTNIKTRYPTGKLNVSSARDHPIITYITTTCIVVSPNLTNVIILKYTLTTTVINV
jgi:hypothetical protein